MDVSWVTLKAFKRIVQDTIMLMKRRDVHPSELTHLRITESWLVHEDDEHLFELLKRQDGPGEEYIRRLLENEEVYSEGSSKDHEQSKRRDRKSQIAV